MSTRTYKYLRQAWKLNLNFLPPHVDPRRTSPHLTAQLITILSRSTVSALPEIIPRSPARELTKSSQDTEDELTARINILKEDLHEADKRADNSERQVQNPVYCESGDRLQSICCVATVLHRFRGDIMEDNKIHPTIICP